MDTLDSKKNNNNTVKTMSTSFQPSDFAKFIVGSSLLLGRGEGANPQSKYIVDSLLDESLRNDLDKVQQIYKANFSYSWSVWLDNIAPGGVLTQKMYSQKLNEIGEISNIIMFCEEWNNLSQGETFSMYSNLRIFKKGIPPMYEDVSNKDGGKWVLTFSVNFQEVGDSLPDEGISAFLNIVIHMISGQFGHEEEFCGATLQVRPRGLVLGIWNKDATNKTLVDEMTTYFITLTGIDPSQIRYQVHEGTLKQHQYNPQAVGKFLPLRGRGLSGGRGRGRGFNSKYSASTPVFGNVAVAHFIPNSPEPSRIKPDGVPTYTLRHDSPSFTPRHLHPHSHGLPPIASSGSDGDGGGASWEEIMASHLKKQEQLNTGTEGVANEKNVTDNTMSRSVTSLPSSDNAAELTKSQLKLKLSGEFSKSVPVVMENIDSRRKIYWYHHRQAEKAKKKSK